MSFWASACSFCNFASFSALISAMVRRRLLEAFSMLAEMPLLTRWNQKMIKTVIGQVLTRDVR